MARQDNGRPSTDATSGSNKRKNASSNTSGRQEISNKRPRFDPRAKQKDARTLATQSSSKAFKNGELDVEKFVKAREYEIRALEEGMSRSKKALTRRAFQQVPKDLRRRTASHNAKRVPKKLRARAVHEMKEDNTPTVTARRRQLTRHMRLRIETAKRLRLLAGGKPTRKSGTTNVRPSEADAEQLQAKTSTGTAAAIRTRKAKAKPTRLAEPPVPKAKYRKRQKTKTWLPTHIFHAKRAHICPPGEPLWKFALPLSPTAKCYRATHRAANERGAIAWDTSYFASIGIEGQQKSIDDMFKALHIDQYDQDGLRKNRASQTWQAGTRTWTGFVSEPQIPHSPIAPVTILWSVALVPADSLRSKQPGAQVRNVIIRVHPSAFMRLWEELVLLSKLVKPQVKVEDLRFEIGSLEVAGPGATEALLGALQPSQADSTTNIGACTSVEKTWSSLAGVTDVGLLPTNALLGMRVKDPRLQHPPRSINIPTSDSYQQEMLNTLAKWPVDSTQGPADLFKRDARLAASRALPSQKAINRRKALASPGQYPEALSSDPQIPVILYCVAAESRSQRKWVVLMPWKCVQPIWYSLMYYPLSTGGQSRFGGLEQVRQLAFEAGSPWFPGDFPGTSAGMEWEAVQREKRRDAWQRKPKSKRVNWETLAISPGTKGEIGDGWACDWERLVYGPTQVVTATDANAADAASALPGVVGTVVPRFVQITTTAEHSKTVPNGLAAVRVRYTTRGVPQVCARIYRLPTSDACRKQWLNQALSSKSSAERRCGKSGIPRLSHDTPPHIAQQRLARSLLELPHSGQSDYPACPSEDDLIGFVTSGNYNLGEGQGTAVGNILLCKALDTTQERGKSARWCIVRNAGSSIGRLATWDFAF